VRGSLRRLRPWLAWCLGALALTAACGGSQPRARQPIAPSPPSPPAATPPCAAAQADTRAAGVRSGDPVLQLASGLDEPDDLLVQGGQVLVGELGSGRVARVGGDAPVGAPERLPVKVPVVEGLAVIGGTLYAADQADDRVVTVHGSQTATFLQLRAVPGVEGVDGIAAQGSTLVVPDSPHGTVLFVDQGGRVVRRAGGFARPTGPWPLADGSVLIADENAGAVERLAPDGGRAVLAGGVPLADDVAEDGRGTVYAISIADGSLVRVAGDRPVDVAAGLGEPQGLGLDGAGNPIVTEYSRGRLDAVVTSFKLQPPLPGGPALAPRQPLCVALDRAPGFTAPVEIRPGPGYTVLRQPGAGSQGSVLPSGCSGQCRLTLTAASGGAADAVELAYRR
jgi:hypothetical protein